MDKFFEKIGLLNESEQKIIRQLIVNQANRLLKDDNFDNTFENRLWSTSAGTSYSAEGVKAAMDTVANIDASTI